MDTFFKNDDHQRTTLGGLKDECDHILDDAPIHEAGSHLRFHLRVRLDEKGEEDVDQDVKVRIFNIAGRLKRILTQENKSGSGNQLIVWDGKDHDGSVVPSGMYIVTLEREDKILRTTVGVLNR